MKTITRSILLCSIALLLTLSPAPCRAVSPTFVHNFHEMFYEDKPATLTVTNSNQTGTVTRDKITYTCSGGALFSADYKKTSSKLTIYLETSSAHFVTTTQIQNLDSLWIDYAPYDLLDITVKISTDSSSWSDVSAISKIPKGPKHVKMPSVGDYYVRIMYSDKNVYIRQINYTCLDLSACPNCFIYRPE